MSYTITNTRGQVIAIIANEVADTSTTLTLLGRNFAGYGTIIADDFIRLLENSASDTVFPPSPIQGELCYRIDSRSLLLWNGSSWMMVGMAGGDTFPNLVFFDAGFIVRNILAPTNCKMRRIRIDNGGSFLIEGLNDDFSVKVIPLTISCDGFMHAAATPAPTDDSTTLATTAFVQIKVRLLQSEIDNLQTQINQLWASLGANVNNLQAEINNLQAQINALNAALAHVVPYGIITMWAGSVQNIPAGWALCDGGNGTPNLLDRFIVGAGYSYAPWQAGGAGAYRVGTEAAGNGSYLSDPGGVHIHTTDAQGAHGHNIGGASLDISQMPHHDHGFTVNGQVIYLVGYYTATGVQAYYQSLYQTDFVTPHAEGSGGQHFHSIDVQGLHGHNLSAPTPGWGATDANGNHQHWVNVGAHAHFVTTYAIPPYFALCYIMKIT